MFFNTGMPSTTGVFKAMFSPKNREFVVVYLAVGGAFAVLVFFTAMVSIPMVLDRDTDAISAAITSLRVMFSNPGVVLLWGAVADGRPVQGIFSSTWISLRRHIGNVHGGSYRASSGAPIGSVPLAFSQALSSAVFS